MSDARFIRCNECRALNEPRALFCSRCGASLYGPVHGASGRRRTRITAAGVAMGVALLLALAVITIALGLVISRSLQDAENIDPYTGQTGTAATVGTASTVPTTGDGAPTTLALAPIQVRPTAAEASSVLKATSTNSYRATNLLDGDLTTAWEEGAAGPGLGEWVRFEFSSPVVLARIEIANGCQRDEERFQGNPRIRSLKLELSNGVTKLIDLADSTDIQTITIDGDSVEWVKLIVVSVYDGDRWEDTALSEVRVFEQPQ